MVSGFFGLKYNGLELNDWFDNHPIYKGGYKTTTIDPYDSLFAEFRACMALGIDPDVYFKKDKLSRMMITGGYIADNALTNMRNYDVAKDRERELRNKK